MPPCCPEIGVKPSCKTSLTCLPHQHIILLKKLLHAQAEKASTAGQQGPEDQSLLLPLHHPRPTGEAAMPQHQHQLHSRYDYQPERHEQLPVKHPQPSQPHVQHAQPDVYHDPYQSHASPQSHYHAQYPPQTGKAAKQPPAVPPVEQQAANPSPEDFPPLHQAAAVGTRKQLRGRRNAPHAPHHHQLPQPPPQQVPPQVPQERGTVPGTNQGYSSTDLHHAHQQPVAANDGNQMALMQMQLQMQQMQQQMLSMMGQQQGGDTGSIPQVPTLNQPAFQPNQAFPSSFPSVGPGHPFAVFLSMDRQTSGTSSQTHSKQGWDESRPSRRLIKGLTENEIRNFSCPITHEIMWEPVVASDGHTYECGAIQKWLAQSSDGQALSPMTQLPLTHTLFPNKIIADLIRDKQAKP